MPIYKDQVEAILYQALNSNIGLQIYIQSDNNDESLVIAPSLRVKQLIYSFRKEIGDIELQNLTIDLCPADPDHRLWIIKTEKFYE